MTPEVFLTAIKNFPNDLDRCNYDQLMTIVEIIEDLDLSEYHYKWLVEGEEYNNFEGIEFEIGGNQVHIWINLSLDPDKLVCHIEAETKKEAIFLAINEFVNYVRNEYARS